MNMFDKIIESCRYLLNNFPEAKECKDYLDSRITAESQEIFKFGYFPDPKNIQVLIDIVGEKALKDLELLYYRQIQDSLGPRVIRTSHFDDHPLIMPFRDTYGNVKAIVGRTLLSEEQRKVQKIEKYKNTKNFKKSNFIFGLYENKQHIINQNSVYIVEGQFDVIKAVERGFKNVVALGTSNMTPYQFSVISRYTDNIFLLLDNDEAGEKGRKLIVSKFGKLANIQNFYLPESYKDIDDYFTKSSEESIPFIVKE
jgi:DNA primase catalytic core